MWSYRGYKLFGVKIIHGSRFAWSFFINALLMRILIVDDEQEICLLLRQLLKKMGVDAEVAHTISGGLETFSTYHYDVVFLDINLPDGSGLDLIPKLKAVNPDTKIIVISAYTSKTEVKKAVDMGIYQFVGKPFSKNTISVIIQNIRDHS